MLRMGLAIMACVASAAAQAIPAPTLASCSWDRPGHRPFMGELVSSVDRYTDIPVATRERLKRRMAERRYDDIADIRRDRIEGRFDYAPEIRDMHFAEGQVCREVTRSRWSDEMVERGLVYCEDGHCLLVPTVCRNLSRIERRPPSVASAPTGDELNFDPPGAGLPLATAALPLEPGDGAVSFEQLLALPPFEGLLTPPAFGDDGVADRPVFDFVPVAGGSLPGSVGPEPFPGDGGGRDYPGGFPGGFPGSPGEWPGGFPGWPGGFPGQPGGPDGGPWGPYVPPVVVVVPPGGVTAPIPEPTTVALLALGLAALSLRRRLKGAAAGRGA